MKIFLTGASGMVGRNLLEHEEAGNHTWLTPRHSDLDLTDFIATCQYIDKKQPDLIIHAAGRVGGIQANMREPVRFLIENLDMGRNVLLAAAKAGVPKLINIGSSCMYPRNRNDPLKEEDVLSGELEPTNEGYALAKITIARLADYLCRERSELNYKTVVPCNLYGRHDKFDPRWSHLIPAIIYKLHQAKITGVRKVEIWGDGNARREFMYAGDLAEALFKASYDLADMPSLMNIGLGYDFTVNEYYQMAAEVIGYDGEFTHDLSKPVGMNRKLTDASKARAWGWVASSSLKEGLAKTYDFYLNTMIGNK
ncbi:GDP-L-fucose synthase family protein [Pseudogulbenkiania ferrooxidans]|nr:GDP-L-fucose synthase [Pseudogulbenkiania ferrooxidans]